MTNYIKIWVSAILALCLCSCEKELREQYVEAGELVPVSFRIVGLDEPAKSILEEESLDSGYYIMAFESSGGGFVDCFSFESVEGGTVSLRAGSEYDFYVLGNLWYIDQEGRKLTLEDIGVRSVAGIPYYRFDGKQIRPGVRTENFGEMEQFGIPYSGFRTNCPVSPEAVITLSATRLFAKVSVTVDHSGLVNGEMNSGVFENMGIYIRNANCRLHPFIENAATGEDDLLESSDYCLDMPEGDAKSVTFYVPENMQGKGTVSSPSNKTLSVKPLSTYVEFSGMIHGDDGTAGGYGGTVMYRFCLGANNTDDFNLKRGGRYEVTLGFRAGSVFSPEWKVSTGGDWADTRRVTLLNDAGDFAKLRRDTILLAVRPWHNERYHVYFNRTGVIDRSTDEFAMLREWDESYSAANVGDNAWSWSIDRSRLEACGVYMSGIDDEGNFNVSVEDEALFEASAGTAVPLYIKLYPGGVTTVVNITMAEMNDVVFNEEYEAYGYDYEEFYIGMARRMKTVGFYGSPVLYADRDGVIRTDQSRDFLSSRPVPFDGNSITLYFYSACSMVTVTVSSDDPFNDAYIPFYITVYKPQAYGAQAAYLLPADGTKVGPQIYYRDIRGEKIPFERFDRDMYYRYMQPECRIVSSSVISSIGLEPTRDSLYLKWTNDVITSISDTLNVFYPGGPMDSLNFRNRMPKIGVVRMVPRDSTLFDFRTEVLLTTAVPELASFTELAGNPYSSVGPGSDGGAGQRLLSAVNLYGCTSKPEIFYSLDSGDDGAFPTEPAFICPESAGGIGNVEWSYDITPEWARGVFPAASISLPYGKRRVALRFMNRWSRMAVDTEEREFEITHGVTFSKCPIRRLGQSRSYIAVRPPLCAWVFEQWAKAGYVRAQDDIVTGITIPEPYGFENSLSMTAPDESMTNQYMWDQNMVGVTDSQVLDGSNDPYRICWYGNISGKLIPSPLYWNNLSLSEYVDFYLPGSLSRTNVITIR